MSVTNLVKAGLTSGGADVDSRPSTSLSTIPQTVLLRADLWAQFHALAGIIVPARRCPPGPEWIGNAMPASNAREAMRQVSAHPGLTDVAVRDMVVVPGFAVLALALAAATLRPRTP